MGALKPWHIAIFVVVFAAALGGALLLRPGVALLNVGLAVLGGMLLYGLRRRAAGM